MVPSARQIVRTVVTVVCVALALYLLYLLRKPISWILIAGFLAVALSPPVNVLSRHMRRGFAITITFLGLLAIPIALIALIVPPLITEANDFADNVPQYARDVTKYVKENDRLRKINEDYDITSKLEDEAGKLPNRLGGAAGTLRDVGFGIVNSLFAADHDPRAHRLHPGQRPQLDRRRDQIPTTRAARAPAARPRQHGLGGGRLRGRRDADRADRGHRDLRRAD